MCRVRVLRNCPNSLSDGRIGCASKESELAAPRIWKCGTSIVKLSVELSWNVLGIRLYIDVILQRVFL